MTLSTILMGLKSAGSFLKKNPSVILALILAGLIIFGFEMHRKNQELKNNIDKLEDKLKEVEDRFKGNVEALNGQIEYLEGDTTYLRSTLRIKDGELSVLDQKLNEAYFEISELKQSIGENTTIQTIYITEVSANVKDKDVSSHIDKDTLGNFAVGISDTGSFYSVNTKTWFRFVPSNNVLSLELVDKYGEGKSSLLSASLDFGLTLAKIRLENGNTRVLVRAKDKNGNLIPQDKFRLKYINGVDFIDFEPEKIEESERRMAVLVGPSYGLYLDNNVVKLGFGLGVSVGYRLY